MKRAPRVQTIVDDDGEISLVQRPRLLRPQATPESMPTKVVRRLRGKSQFFWGVLVGVAFMSALFGIVIFLLFWQFTAA
ncbi:hypothetical protein HY624_00645 [Candidatus Uhrbacteria bacterium]|nr:hypothetical protein [Candidatus Uhrbacteria bacterium]